MAALVIRRAFIRAMGVVARVIRPVPRAHMAGAVAQRVVQVFMVVSLAPPDAEINHRLRR